MEWKTASRLLCLPLPLSIPPISAAPVAFQQRISFTTQCLSDLKAFLLLGHQTCLGILLPLLILSLSPPRKRIIYFSDLTSGGGRSAV